MLGKIGKASSMSTRKEDREPQWGPSLEEQRTDHVARQTRAIEAIERVIERSGNREYSEYSPVEVTVDMGGLGEYVGAVSDNLGAVQDALHEAGRLMNSSLTVLAEKADIGNETLDAINAYTSYLPDVLDAQERSNALLMGIGGGIGVVAAHLVKADRRRSEELASLDETLGRGFDDVREGLDRVADRVDDAAAQTVHAVHDGARRVSDAVVGSARATHALLHGLGVISQRHHLALLERMTHLHTTGVEVLRTEVASIDETLRELAANGRSIEAEELYKFALVDLEAGNQPAAIGNLERALKKRSSNAEAWLLLGMIAFENGGIESARNALSLSYRYAKVQGLRTKRKALGALLMLERLVGNEKAWRALLLEKYKAQRSYLSVDECFEVVRTWCIECPNTDDWPREHLDFAKWKLPSSVRGSVNCGFLVATREEFKCVREHLGSVETYGSWAYIFNDLRIIALRALGTYYGRCNVCGKRHAETLDKEMFKSMAYAVQTVLEHAAKDFRFGLPVRHVDLYRLLLRKRRILPHLSGENAQYDRPPGRAPNYCMEKYSIVRDSYVSIWELIVNIARDLEADAIPRITGK